ncbi:MAG: ABC transporter permease [Candidatus Pacebacteria bacterium]|nr:ABC transporter permease [Candidatus Paceibacterota bacterium]
MFLTNLRRIIRSGFHSFWRNSFVSLAAVLIMVIALSAIGSIMFMNTILDTTFANIKEKVDVNVYFIPEASEQDILNLKASLENLSEIESVEYVTRERVYEDFVENYKNNQTTLKALDELGDNPFGARLNVRAKEISQYQSVAEFLDDQNTVSLENPIIDEVNFEDNKAAIDRLVSVINFVDQFGTLLAIVLMIVSVLITFNTIRLAIYVSREEIGVMRLVGASVSYIRGPFVFSGIMYGLVSGLITLIIFYPITLWLGKLNDNSLYIGINLFDYYVSNFGQIFLVIIGGGIILGAISSYLAVMRYLKS